MNGVSEYAILRGPLNLYCDMHINPELEFVWVQQGRLTVVYDDGRVELQAGEVAMIMPYRLHRFLPADDCVGYVFMFSYTVAEKFYSGYKASVIQNRKVLITDALAGYLQSMIDREGSFGVFEIRSLFYALLSMCMSKLHVAEGECGEKSVLRRVVDFVSEHALEDVTLSAACAQLCVGEARVRRALKTLDMSFGDLIAGIRLSHAISLLSERQKSVTEIAYDCGFGSVRSFNRIFRRVMQCTPSEYRKQIIH